jgi:diamine N-acetyltransferase
MQIQKATISDTKSILIFAKNTFEATYKHLNEPVFFDQYVEKNFTEEAFEKDLSDREVEYWIIKENEAIVAYIKLNINRLHDAEMIIHETSGSMSEVERIYVDESQKGKGLGKILIEKAIERAVFYKNDWLWLGVWEENPKALAFYKHLGFEIFGNHAFYMGDDRQDDFLMRLNLLN